MKLVAFFRSLHPLARPIVLLGMLILFAFFLVIIAAFILTVLALVIRINVLYVTPDHGDWISTDGKLAISYTRAKLITDEGEMDFTVSWGDAGLGDPSFRLATPDCHDVMSACSTYSYDSLYVEWDYTFRFKRSFRMTVKESDLLEAGTTYTFRPMREEDKAKFFPITVTDTLALSGSSLYHRGEYDSAVTWEDALPLLAEKGYFTEKKEHRPLRLYRIEGDTYDFIEIHTYVTPQGASTALWELAAERSVAKGCILRINERILSASNGAAKDLAEIFGFTLPREYAAVDGTVLFESAYKLRPDFEERLKERGFRIEQPWLHYTCTAPDGAYAFNIAYVSKFVQGEDVDTFLRRNAYPTVQGVVFIECRAEDDIYLLAIPFEAAETVLAIITDEN